MFNKILLILALVTTPILTMQSARVDCGSAPSFLEKTHSEHQFINDLHNSQLIKATRFVQKAQDVMNKVCSDNTGDIFLQSRSKLEREQNMKIKSLHSDLKFIPTGENQAQKAIYQNLAGLATNLLQVESRRSEACLKAKVNIDRHSNVVSLIQHHNNKLRNNINTLNSFIQACSFQADDTQVITLPADGNVNQAITSAASNDACTENCDNVEVPAASSNTTEASGNVETGSGNNASTEASGQTESTTPVAETPSTGSSGTESSGSNASECECAACPCENAGSTTTETPAEPSGQTETTTPSSETPVTTVETPVETNTGSSGCTVDCEPVEASTGTESESTPAPTEGSGQSSTETPTSEPATPTESSGNACTSGCETAGSGTESGQASTETPVSEPVETATPEVSECNECGGATTETNTGTESGQASTETPVSEPVTPAQPAGNDCNECANTGTVTETVVPVQQPTESAQAPTETPVSEPAVPSTPSQGSECTTCGAVITVNVGDCADCGSNGGAAQAPTETPVSVTPPATSTCVETVSTGGSAQVPTEVPVSEPAQPAQPVSSGCNECGGAVQTETVTPAPTQTTEVIVIPTPTQTGQSSTETPVSQPVTTSSGCNECGSSTGTVVTEQPAPSTTEVIVIPTPSAQTETVVPTSEPVVTPAPTTTCDCFECGCHSGTVVQQPPATETITVTESVVPVGTTGQTETITPPAQTPEVPVSVPVASGCNECDGGADNGGASGQVGGDIPISIGTVNVGGNDNGGCDGCFGISNGGNDGNGLVFALRGSGR